MTYTTVPATFAHGNVLPPETVDQIATNQADHERRMRAEISVVDSQWAGGAKFDGVTDDTAAMQAALDYARTVRGIVKLPAGTAITTGVTTYSYVTIRGQGADATTLQLKAGTHAAVIQTYNFATLTGQEANAGLRVGGEHHFAIEGLSVFGDKTNNLTDYVPLVQIYGYGYRLHDIIVYYGRSGGIWSEWGIATDTVADLLHVPEATWSDVTVHNCDCQGSGQDLIHFLGPHDSRWIHVLAANSANTGAGAYVGANAAGLEAVNCHMATSVVDAWKLDGLAFLVNCYGEGGSHSQLLINASDTVVVGGIYLNGSVAAASATGIIIGGSVAPANCRIDTKVLKCLLGAVSFANDGGTNHVALNVTQASGSAYVGTPATSDEVFLLVSGGATGQFWQIPTNVVLGAPTPTIVPGPAGLHIRNNANTVDNWSVNDEGLVTVRGGVTIGSGRVQASHGADIASSNNITLGTDGNKFAVTGATQLNAIDITGWQSGADVVLRFATGLTVKHNTGGSGTYKPILLAGSVDLVATANTRLSLYYDAAVGFWQELARTVA